MKVLIRNRIRESVYRDFFLAPPRRRRRMPWRWVQAKGNSATFAKIIRFYNLETGNRVPAAYLEEAMNIRYGRVEQVPAFKYRGKPRRLFIRNARIRYPHSLGRSCIWPGIPIIAARAHLNGAESHHSSGGSGPM